MKKKDNDLAEAHLNSQLDAGFATAPFGVTWEGLLAIVREVCPHAQRPDLNALKRRLKDKKTGLNGEKFLAAFPVHDDDGVTRWRYFYTNDPAIHTKALLAPMARQRGETDRIVRTSSDTLKRSSDPAHHILERHVRMCEIAQSGLHVSLDKVLGSR